MLAENKEIVSYIINEGITRGYKFVAITNGYDLDCYGDLLSPDKIYKVQITVDGPKNYMIANGFIIGMEKLLIK